jgi:hypothetical protein
MGKKAPKAPPPIDPAATARAQSDTNRQTAITQFGLNAVNQYTPYGSLEYGQAGTWADGTPRFTATQRLSPAEQEALDLSNRAQSLYGNAAVRQLGAVQEQLGQPFQFDAGPYGDTAMGRNAVETALMERLQPQLDRDRAAMETRLANQGIMLGSEAYRNAMSDYERQVADQRLAIVGAAGQEENRMAALRQQRLQEQLALRGQPINEATALLTGQMVGMPQFVNTPQTNVAPTDYLGAVQMQQAALQNQYNNKFQSYQAQLNQLYGLGSAALGGWASGGFSGGSGGRQGSAQLAQTAATVAGGTSDIRVKKNIRQVGALENGLPVYAFQYVWGGPTIIGLMAQDVEQVNPDAVFEIGGIKHVNYDAAVEG